jgi:hypothetical protein
VSLSGSPSDFTFNSSRSPNLLCRNADLALIVAIQAECHPHHAVEAALITVPEAHHGDIAQIERAHDG